MQKIEEFLRWCGFHIHEWGDWESFGEVINKRTGGTLGLCQISECKTCHKKRSTKIWYI